MLLDQFPLYLILAVVFGFIMAWGIGANDVSNAMGTSVGSRAISIKQALIIAAIFEFLGAFFAGGEVTGTIRHNIIDLSVDADDMVIVLGMLASLLASALWLITACFFGWPVSTTHTIVGALIGFGVVHIGLEAIKWKSIFYIIISWIVSPILGLLLSYGLFCSMQYFIFDTKNPLSSAKKVVPIYIFITAFIIFFIILSKLAIIGINLSSLLSVILSLCLAIITALYCRVIILKLKLDLTADKVFHFTNVEKIFSILMLITACAMAFAHGSNDVANAIGPVAAIDAIVKKQFFPNDAIVNNNIPVWILLLGALGIIIGLGMYGHKVIATVGSKITQLTPSRGFCATLATALTVVIASSTGLPISTTHTLVGGILGVGLARGMGALNMMIIRNIFISWVVTLPAGGVLAVLSYLALKPLLIWS